MRYSKIEGGYVLRPRSAKHSDLAHSPPVVREIFEWLVREANHETNKICARGQCIRTYKDIQDGLHWMQGFIKRQYSKWDCERALKTLRFTTRIATRKTTRGLLITIVNYDFYQNPKNYKAETLRPTRQATRKPQRCATINNNDNNGITNKHTYTDIFENFWKLFKGRWKPKEGDYGKYEKGSKADAFVEWEKLTPTEQQEATKVAPHSGGEFTPDCCRWLKQKRWEK